MHNASTVRTDDAAALCPVLTARQINIAIAGRMLVRGLDLTLGRGDTLAILGRNGSGKTTLLHALAGLRAPESGAIELCGQPHAAYTARAAALLRGLMPQAQLDSFPATVLETALIGRHPHCGRWAWESPADVGIAREALAAVDLSGLEDRDVSTLSGGERQRLAFATLLTQQPQLHLLDEPLAHLDLNHQIALLEQVRHRAAEGGTFVIVLHDVNLALRYCRRVLLLHGDGRWQEGPVADVLTAESLSELYAYPMRELKDVAGRHFIPG